MIQNFKAISIRRKALAGLMVLTLATSAIFSLAALTDLFEIDGNFSTASIDLTGNGEQSLTVDWAPGFTGTPYAEVYSVELTNEGTVELRYAIDTTAVYTPATGNGWQAVAFTIHSVPNAASCTVAGTNAGNALAPAGGGVNNYEVGDAAPGQQAGDRLLASGASEVLCLKVMSANPTFGASDSATNTILFNAEATGL